MSYKSLTIKTPKTVKDFVLQLDWTHSNSFDDVVTATLFRGRNSRAEVICLRFLC